MSLDLQCRFCLRFRDQSRQKDHRCSLRCRVGFNPRRQFAAIRFRHRNISGQKVYETILEAVGERIETHAQQGESQTPWRAYHHLRKFLDRLP